MSKKREWARELLLETIMFVVFDIIAVAVLSLIIGAFVYATILNGMLVGALCFGIIGVMAIVTSGYMSVMMTIKPSFESYRYYKKQAEEEEKKD